MAQDYKLLQLDKGDNFQDNHGNFWVTAVFEGVQQEVKWVVKSPMDLQIGNNYYGDIQTVTSKAGKPYLRFKREQRPDANQASFSNTPPAQSSNMGGSYQDRVRYQPKDEAAIKAMWSIGQAVQLLHGTTKTPNEAAIHLWASKFYEMVDEIKNGTAHITDDQAVSTYQAVVSGEPVDESEIPPEYR